MPPRDLTTTPTIDPIENITRRRLLTAMPVLGLVAAGMACGDDDEDADEPETQSDSGGGYPRTVTHSLGDIVIPSAPQRIVLLSDNEPLDSLLQLGARPVQYLFAGGYIGRSPEWIADLVEGVPSHALSEASFGEYDMEWISAQRPDLIIGVWMGAEVYDDLLQIAPTMSVKEVEETTWQEIHRMIGAALDQSALAEEQIGETEEVFASEAPRLEPYRDRSVAIAYEWADQLNIHGEESQIAKIVKELGLEVVAPAPGITVTSTERWQDIADADLILSPSFSGENMEAQLSNPLFLGLPAVQNSCWGILNPEMAQAGYMESALSTKWLIPKIVDAVIAAAEGQGE